MLAKPKHYIVPVNNGFVVLPFGEGVCERLKTHDGPTMTAEEAYAATKGDDVSIVYNPKEWGMLWIRGSNLTMARIENCRLSK